MHWDNNEAVVKHKAMINDEKLIFIKTSQGWNLKTKRTFIVILYFHANGHQMDYFRANDYSFFIINYHMNELTHLYNKN